MAIAAIRYNNPGNVSLPIQGWNGGGSIVGIAGQSGYASFPDMQTGFAAFQARLTNYIDGRGLNTIGALNGVYAQDPAWGAGVSNLSGIGINTPLDTSNASQMSALQSGIIQQETGMSPAQLGIDTGGGVQTSGWFAQQGGDPVGAIPQSFDQPNVTPGFDASGAQGQTDIGTPSGTEGFGQAGGGVSGAPVGIPDTPNQGSGGFGSNPLTQMGIGGASGDTSTGFGSGPTAGGADSGAGAPIVITDISAAGGKGAGPQIQSGLNQAGQDVSKTGTQLDQTLNSDTGQITSSGTGWLQYASNILFDLFPRISVSVLAVVLIGAGIWLLGLEKKRA